jgi:hypothetical protein
VNDEDLERQQAEIKALGDVTDPKNNPLIPGADEPVDAQLTPEGNSMIPTDGEAADVQRQEQRLRSTRPAAAAGASGAVDVLGLFLKNEIEVEAGLDLIRMAGGNVMLIKDGIATPFDQASPEDIEKVRAALQR